LTASSKNMPKISHRMGFSSINSGAGCWGRKIVWYVGSPARNLLPYLQWTPFLILQDRICLRRKPWKR
jgi:hypothetical protein